MSFISPGCCRSADAGLDVPVPPSCVMWRTLPTVGGAPGARTLCACPLCAYLLPMRIRLPYTHSKKGLDEGPPSGSRQERMGVNSTHAGQPKPIARQASTVFPFPYPSFSYKGGANSGKPKPAIDRRNDTAARAIVYLGSISTQGDTADLCGEHTRCCMQCKCIHNVGLHALEGEDHGSADKGHALKCIEVRNNA